MGKNGESCVAVFLNCRSRMGPTVAAGCSGGVGRSGAARTSDRRDRSRPLVASRRHSIARACCGGQVASAECSGATRASGRSDSAHLGEPGAQAGPVMAGPAPAIPRPHRGAAPPLGGATGAAWGAQPSSRLLAPRDQERGKGAASGWRGLAAEGGSAQGTGQSSAETE